MTAYPVASEEKINETLTVLGAENLGSTEQTLLQQIIAACAISGFPAPTGFTATAGDQQITLTWDAQPAADTFTIKFGITNVLGAASVLTSSATGTSFVFDSGESIQAGEKYYFWISATGSEGTSAFRGNVTARSFVTLADGASANLQVPSDLGGGSTTLGQLIFASVALPTNLVLIFEAVSYVTFTGLGWFNASTFDPADDVIIDGPFILQNSSGASFTFWNSEP